MTKIFANTPEDSILAHIATMEREVEPTASSEIVLQDRANKLDVIMKFWPYIKPVLSIAKIFTNSKIDALIDAVIAWGDNYTDDGE